MVKLGKQLVAKEQQPAGRRRHFVCCVLEEIVIGLSVSNVAQAKYAIYFAFDFPATQKSG